MGWSFLFPVVAVAIVLVAARGLKWRSRSGYTAPSATPVAAFKPIPVSVATPTAELIKLCTHWNGYQREAALRALAAKGDVTSLPALLERANDWVPQVRAAAIEAIDAVLAPAHAGAVVHQLPELERLRVKRRVDHSELVQRVEDFLVRPDNRQELLAGLQHEDPRIRRESLRLCAARGLLEAADLVRIALGASDLWLRRLAATKLRELNPQALLEILPVALKDRFMPMRREALQIRLRDPAYQTAAALIPWLFDRHYAVREIAMHSCARAKVDATVVYRAELDNPSASVHRTRCALLGLAALGDQAALPAIRARLDSGFPRIRLAALAALARSPPDQFEELCLHSLFDPSSAVVRTARHFLLRASTSVGTAKLMELVSHPIAESSFRACLMLATRASKWDHLAFLLSVLQRVEKDSARRDDLMAELWRWDSAFNRTHAVATPSQLSQLSASLSTAKPSIPEALAERIAFTLRVATRRTVEG